MTDIPAAADLSADQRRALACVLDALVPPSPDGRLPGAGAAGVATHVERTLRTLPDLRAMVVDGLRDLDVQARAQHGRPFVACGEGERAALVAAQGFGYALVPHTYVGYYQQDAVLEAIGMEPRPPHPKGYTVAENDLSLLAPVKARSKRYREC
ncbi:MAG: gluconate 2-dehydrogenase subunit 3 family protein [Deltaproteobacteria bacterium]|nr:gluconate 2-dehydrogenase subunit 3 family protein [Deltaproteobacteria bacterium]